ncbi:hypothetical protein K1T71_001939 [Dendrolimus kikuchii]|uniref:Uncharacterized protein n=1 Tax=Dendrolimus kikuchii TaxID=765133 RepID=A0ACC1DFH1_9NEOP|nr:hypothetical protein K1T71_001939 [Dendrolimus kikuchii]
MGLLVKYIVAGLVRYWLIHTDYWQILANRVEIATPLNSWKRLIEGVYLYDRKIDPYDGDSFHESPILLLFFHYVLKKMPFILPVLFTVLDLVTAHLLYKTSKGFIRIFIDCQERNASDVSCESKDMLLKEYEMREASEYVLSVYLFNPYSVLNCVGLTTTVVQNLFVAAALCGATYGYGVVACIFLALATHQALYPVLLIVPIAMIVADVNKGCIKCSYLKTLLAFVLNWGFLIFISAYIMDGSYQYVYNTYGFILTVPDLKPNIGLFWYFFTEMFEHFRLLFVCAFQINALVLYIVPLTLRFKREPILLVTVLLALSTVFRSYPCVGDVGFYMAFLPIWRHLFTFMQQKFIVGCAFIITSALGPTVLTIYTCASIIVTEGVILPSIPQRLLPCYRSGAPDLSAPKRLDVFLSLLRKVELNSQLDMRLLSTGLLRSLRLDGIEQSSAGAVETEFVLPFRASGFQFHKYKLLMDLFLPSQDNILNVDEILTVGEKCMLHKIISSTVWQWERGDENVVCPVSAQMSMNMAIQSNTSVNSRCPIEEGVIQTEWGTISPGTVMAAVASAMEAQRVSISDIFNANIYKEDVAEPLMSAAMQEWYENIETLDGEAQRQIDPVDISNIWVATLAGDLSEVVVNQGPRVGPVSQRMIIGSNERWNDTLLPRNHYIFPQNSSIIDWHFTDAEILAGIDGLILANFVPEWVEQRRTLRVSQIIEMYYSNEGVSFNPTVKACNRQSLFLQVFNSTDLFREASRFAHVLSLRQITVYIPVEEMERITDAAVTAFTTYLPNLLRQNHRDCQISHSIPVMDVIVATDGSWKGYDVEEFMSWLGGALEMDAQRSTISLMHGNTGAWIVPPSHNVTVTFSHINNFTDEWPNRMSLPTIMSNVIQYSLNKSLHQIEIGASAGPSTMVLIISPSDRPSSTELDRVRELMTTLRSSYFDVYFAYVAQDLTDFQNINNEYLDYSELFLSTTSISVHDVIEAVDTHLIKSNIPMTIFGVQCPVNGTVYNQTEYEDFVLPGRQTYYRIHPFYLRQQPMIQIQFRNDGQGHILVCTWRGADVSHSCQAIAERGFHIFNLTTPCPSLDFCPPAHFVTSVTSTANLCAHNDCRFPNQVGYYIRHSGLRCLPLRGAAIATKLNNLIFLMFILFILHCV